MSPGPAERTLILGLTGSIGMGKSTVATMFQRLGVPVFDADSEVRRMQGPRGPLLPAIERQFPGTTGAEGVNRAALGERVFRDPAALAMLESIVHPAVRAAREEFLVAHAGAPLVVFDIPLLFEKGGIDEVDRVAVVSAPAEVQRARVLAREGMTPERYAEIIALQLPDAHKRARADYVIDTGCPLPETEAQVRRLVEKLTRH
jgi:dephospho-CoA kinase